MQLKKGIQRLASIADFFSIDLLIKTLFAPFRQISAGKVDGSLNVKFQAFVDRLFSRIIGAIMRTFMIILGSVSLMLSLLVTALLLLFWPIVPLLPVAGVALSIIGWLPWK